MKYAAKHTQQGLTVVEILIALALGVLLSSALIQIFTSTRQISNVETALSRLQETGRFALDAIVQDIRMAGYQGCADPNELQVTVMATDISGGVFSSAHVRGFEVADSGAFAPALSAGDALESIQATSTSPGTITTRPGTDVISVTFANSISEKLVADTNLSGAIKVSSNPGAISDEDFAIVSDCKSAHVFKVTAFDDSTSPYTVSYADSANNPSTITPGYQIGAQLMSYENRVYFVADTGRTTESGVPVYALYVKEFNGAAQELLEGVENLQIEYGQQLGNGNIRYVKANDANLDFSQVVSVRIGLLIQSFEQVAQENDAKTYSLPGASISNASASPHAGDRALRQTFTATVKLRNRRQEI